MSTAASTITGSLDRHGGRLGLGVVLAGVAAAVAVLVTESVAIASLTHMVSGGLALVALPLGVWVHRPRSRTPWLVMWVAMLAFLFSGVLREASVDATGAAPLADMSAGIQDAFSFVGYGLLVVAAVLMLRATGARRDAGALADGVMVTIAAALLSWTFLISPTLSAVSSQRELSIRLVMASYPIIDAFLVFLVTRLALAMRTRGPSLYLAVQAFGCLLAGDTAYALVDVGAPIPMSVLDALYLLSYSGLAASALHPSMRTLTALQPVRTVSLRRSRLAVVAGSMLIPAVLLVVRPPDGSTERMMLAGGLAGITLAALWRTSSAVNGHARDAAAMAHASAHDVLTGLPNWKSLVRHTNQALVRADGRRHVAVAHAGVDGFKLVNESWGHPAGDELLLTVAARLRGTLETGEFLARPGGDEFVLVCEGEGATARAHLLAQRIINAVADPFTLRAGRAHVTASIGLADSRDREGAVKAEELIRDADTARHQAKAQGRNRSVTFDGWMAQHSAERIALQLALRDAIAADEITVAYQPLVQLGTGRLLGFEALARWDRAGVGPVSPLDFIPVAEETGLIVPLGAAVLCTAVTQLARWRALAPDEASLHVSVNVATRQLADPGFADLVAGVLAAHGVPGNALWLEITESVIVQDDDATLSTLQQLDVLGVTLAVDDFGTGYSSLSYLKRFPVGVLKVDQSFIADLGVDPDAEAIIAAVVAMAQALNLQVVAEGVETTLQRDRLRELGCGLAQGWLYGRPVQADEAGRTVLAATRPAQRVGGRQD